MLTTDLGLIGIADRSIQGGEGSGKLKELMELLEKLLAQQSQGAQGDQGAQNGQGGQADGQGQIQFPESQGSGKIEPK